MKMTHRPNDLDVDKRNKEGKSNLVFALSRNKRSVHVVKEVIKIVLLRRRQPRHHSDLENGRTC